MVINKPPGLLAVPGRGAATEPEKADCVIARIQQSSHADALIVHRLDQATSGLMVLAKGADNHRCLSRQFECREVEKTYLAVIHGRLPQTEGRIELPVGADWPNRPRQMVDHARGKPSLTLWLELGTGTQSGTSLVQLTPHNGRTHQLRVHMQAMGHPIVGDTLYGGTAAPRLMLHAHTLSFAHPVGLQRMHFVADPIW